MPLAAGKTLGHYSIVAPIGAGAMGEVYRARDTRLGREVAVKVLPADKMNGDRLRRFLREASAAARLNHPNVVAIHDIGEHEGVRFIVMEYIDMGGPQATLALSLINLGRPDEAVEWLEKANSALSRYPGWSGYLGIAYARAGRRADAERFMAELLDRRKKQPVSTFALIFCALGLGDVTQVLNLLEAAVEERNPWFGFIPGNPFFEPLRTNPRFVEIMKQVNLPNSI